MSQNYPKQELHVLGISDSYPSLSVCHWPSLVFEAIELIYMKRPLEQSYHQPVFDTLHPCIFETVATFVLNPSLDCTTNLRNY